MVGLSKPSEESEYCFGTDGFPGTKFSDELHELHWNASPSFSVWQTGHSIEIAPNHCPERPKMQALLTVIRSWLPYIAAVATGHYQPLPQAVLMNVSSWLQALGPARRRHLLALESLVQFQKALNSRRAQGLDKPVHGNVLRVGVVLGNNTQIFIIFIEKPEDGSALSVHVWHSLACTHSASRARSVATCAQNRRRGSDWLAAGNGSS